MVSVNLQTGKNVVGQNGAIPRVVLYVLLLVSLGLSSAFGVDRGLAEVRSLVQQNKLSEAQQQLQKLLARNSRDASALSLMGDVKNRQRQYHQAEELFKKAIQIEPGLVTAQHQLAKLYADEERTDEAIAVYEKVRKLQPQSAKAREQLSTLYEQVGKREKSLELAKSIPVAVRPDRLLPVMVSDYLGLKQSEEAQRIVGEILRKAPGNPELVPQLASIFLRQGMAGDAAELLHIAEPHQKSTASFLAALARAQSATGQADLAKVTIGRALELDPAQPDVLLEKARLDGNAGDWSSAAKSLQKIMQVTPPRASVLRNLLFAAMQTNDLQTAHDAASDLYDLNPDSPDNALGLSVVLVRASHWGEAKPLLEKVLAARPEDKGAQLAYGIVQYNLGAVDQATQLLTASLGQGASDSEARYMLGLIAKQRGDIPGAVHEMELSQAAGLSRPEALTSLGQLYLQLNEPEKARTVLEKAVDKRPNDAQTHYQLGLAYRKLNLMDQAREQMEIFQKLSVRKIPQPTGEAPDSQTIK